MSSVSFAGGGSIVRNGGGLGEMSAVIIFQKMQGYLNSCIQSAAACSLSEQEVVLIKKVSTAMPIELKSFQLQFFSASEGPDLLTANFVGSPILIRSGALANSVGVPNSFSEIGSLVLFGLLKHQEVDSVSLAQKIFWSLKIETTSFFVDSEQNQIHWLRIEANSSEVFDELVLEQTDHSYDLYPLIQKLNFCEISPNLKVRIQRMTLPIPMSKTVVLDVKWNCGGERLGRAKIKIELVFSETGSFSLGSTKASAFGVIKP